MAYIIAVVLLCGFGLVWSFFRPDMPFVLLAGGVLLLLVELFSLRRRITRLEHKLEALATTPGPQSREPQPETPPVTLEFELDEQADQTPSPVKPPVPPVIPAFPATAADRLPSSQAPVTEGAWRRRLTAGLEFCTQGNPVLKIGIVVLFFGVGFLLKYAAQRNLIPIELRLAGVAFGALTLLALGWRLRRRHEVYGLGLEGGGIGILYLTVFAAAKLYHLLPYSLALVLMIGLVGFSCALAVLQNSRGLAATGAIGGYLAPVLMATGAGSHVQLFSYYALLNGGILTLAWFKAWRELNLLGFVFTFGIGALWGASAYVPAYFATTEPFLLLFFLMYAAIAVLFAHRQPLNLRGFIDGPLVFGLPIVTGGLQACLVRDFRYGLALSALGFGFFYTGLARLLWRRLSGEMRLLVEAFLALGVVFASLAIPFGLDPEWTSAAWALEGAAMTWVGVRQNRRLAKLFGLILQAGAAVVLLDSPPLPSSHLLFVNHIFLDSALIAIAALFSSYWLDRGRTHGAAYETFLPPVLLTWALIWWYGSGYNDLQHHLYGNRLAPAFLLFACGTTVVLGALIRRFAWSTASRGLLLLLPMMAFTLIAQTMGWHPGSLLAGYGWLAWPLAVTLHFLVLTLFEDELPNRALPHWHSAGLWLLILVLTAETAWQIRHIPGLNTSWATACWGLIPVLLLFLIEYQGDRFRWPVVRFATVYHGPATGIPIGCLLLWTLLSFGRNGNPAPLPYIPLFNPLELIELAIILLLVLRVLRRPPTYPWRKKGLILGAALAFLWLNAVLARSIHNYTGVAYHWNALFASPIYQAALAALWSALALALTVGGAKKEQRTIWLTGAALLALVVLKIFTVDLAGTGTIGRIVSFLVVGLLMLVIGFFAPLPPKKTEQSP